MGAVNSNNYNLAGMKDFINHVQKPQEIRPPYKMENTDTVNEEFYSSSGTVNKKPMGSGLLGGTRDSSSINLFYGFFDNRQQPNFNIVQVQMTDTNVDTDLRRVDTDGESVGDQSRQPLRYQTVDRNNPEKHRTIINSLIDRTSWVKEPEKGTGDVFDLDFGKIVNQERGQDILNEIRWSSGERSENMYDTLMETLADIYYLKQEDIALFDADKEQSYLREALMLIKEDMENRVQEAGGDIRKGLLNYAETVMHYPPNDVNFGKTTDGLPDHGKWNGDFKAGFMIVGNKLTRINPVTEMKLTTENKQQTLLLQFKANGVTYDISYNIADLKSKSIVESAGDEENPQLRTNGVKVDTGDKTIIEFLMEKHIRQDDMIAKFEKVVPETRLGGIQEGRISSLVYMNRLEFIARIGIKDDFNLAIGAHYK